MRFAEETTTAAALQMSKHQAEARFDRAKAEYKSLSVRFVQFPVIEEKMSNAKSLAQQDLDLRDGQFKDNIEAQKRLGQQLAAAIHQSAEVKPQQQPSADLVSRAELDKLQSRFNELLKQTSKTNTAMSDMTESTSSLREMSAKTEKIAQDARGVANSALKEAQNARADAGQKKSEVVSLQTEVNGFRQDLDRIKNNDLKSLSEVLKDRAKERAKQTVLEAESTTLRKQVDVLLARSKLAPSAKPDTPTLPFTREEKDKLQNLWDDGTTMLDSLKEQVASLASFTLGPEDENMDSPMTKDSSLSKKVYALQRFMETVEANLAKQKNDAAGDENTEKKLKNLTIALNNLSTEVGGEAKPPLLQRLSKLELSHEQLEKEVKDAKQGRKLLQPEEAGTGPESVATRLNVLDEAVKGLKKELDTAAQEAGDAVAELVGDDLQKFEKINQELAEANKELAEQQRVKHEALEDALMAVTDDIKANAKETDAATATALDGLRNDVGLKADAAALKELSDRVARLPGRATPGPQSIGGPQANAAPSPRLSNGIAAVGSPAVNGAHSSRTSTSSPQLNGVQPANGLLFTAERFATLELKVNQLTYTTQRLETRFNNVQTEELVKSMADQMSTMYPKAKHFDAAVQKFGNDMIVLHNDNTRNEEFAKSLETSIDTAVADVETVRKTADEAKALAIEAQGPQNMREATAKAISELVLVRQQAGTVQSELEMLKMDVKEHDDMLESGKAALSDVKQNVVEVEDELARQGAKITALETTRRE